MLQSVSLLVTTSADATVESNLEPKNVGSSMQVGCISDHMFVDDVDIEKLPSFFNVKVNNMFRSKDSLLNIMHKIAIVNNFEFDVEKSSQSCVYLSSKVASCSWKFRVWSLNGNSNV